MAKCAAAQRPQAPRPHHAVRAHHDLKGTPRHAAVEERRAQQRGGSAGAGVARPRVLRRHQRLQAAPVQAQALRRGPVGVRLLHLAQAERQLRGTRQWHKRR